jgi:hypothetical protein
MNKLVVRIMEGMPSEPGRLLGWAEARAIARGDGQLHVTTPVVVAIDESGYVGYVSVHWADVNVAADIVSPTVMCVEAGQLVTALAAGPVMRVGPMPTGLAPVTVKSQSRVTIPTGGIGAIAS